MSTVLSDPIDDQRTKGSVWPTAIKYALISSAIVIALQLLLHNLGMTGLDEDGSQKGGFTQTIAFLIIGLIITYLGLKEYRDQYNSSSLSLGEGIKWALITALIGGVIAVFWTYIFFEFIAPDFLATMKEGVEVMLEDQGLSDEEIEQSMSFQSIFFNPVVLSVFGLINSLFFGLIYGLVCGAILKTE